MAQSIVQMLDSTATTFGKEAGYKAATAFADDTSKDGAWGGLLISKLEETIVNWDPTRTSKWAPKEFADGAAGKEQYLAAVAADVRVALDSIGLPAWATGGEALRIGTLGNVTLGRVGNPYAGAAQDTTGRVRGQISAIMADDPLGGFFDSIRARATANAEARAAAEDKAGAAAGRAGSAARQASDEAARARGRYSIAASSPRNARCPAPTLRTASSISGVGLAA